MSAPMIEWVEEGQGPALLFLPGSYSTARVWSPIWGALQDRYRKIAISLPGYGATPETRLQPGQELAQTLDLIDYAIERIGAPVHLVGHSYGGAMALAAALQGTQPPESIVMIEPIPFGLYQTGAPLPFSDAAFATMSQFNTLRQSDPIAAAHMVLSYWGDITTLPEGFTEYCSMFVDVNARDWAGALQLAEPMARLSKISIPVTLARSETTTQAIKGLTDLMADHLPETRVQVISGAGHFLLGSHSSDCAQLIERHMSLQ